MFYFLIEEYLLKLDIAPGSWTRRPPLSYSKFLNHCYGTITNCSKLQVKVREEKRQTVLDCHKTLKTCLIITVITALNLKL